MKITGELLKTERISKNITVQEAAVALKLSSKIITAIEAGDTASLPAKTFVRGFVKSYAEYLKLNPEVVLRQFQEEMGTTSPLPKVPPPPPSLPSENIKAARPAIRHTSQTHSQNQPVKNSPMQQKKLQEDSVNNKIALFISAAILLVAVIVISAKIFNSIKSDSSATSQASDENAAASIVPNYDVDPNAIAAAAVPAPAVAEAPSVPETASVAAEPPPVAAVAASPAPPPAPAPAVIATDDEFPPSAGKPVEVIIEAKKETEIFYAKGNTKQFTSVKLPQNHLQIIKSATGLHIRAADGGAIKIIVNGIDRGLAGANNKQVKLSF